MSEQKLTRRQQAELYLKNPNMRRYLDVIAFTEGTEKNGYYTKFGGGKISDLSRHPNLTWGRTGDGPTSATGRYQFLTKTWNEQAKLLGLNDFGPESQDLAAVSLIMRRGAVDDILNGDIDNANRKLSKEWASLPYNKSPHQHQKTTEQVLQKWEQLGGKDYSSPNHQYDFSTTTPNINTAQTSNVQMPSGQAAMPTSIAPQTAVVPEQENNGFIDYFNNVNTIQSLEPTPQSNRQKYANQLANAFGVNPTVENGLPDYISDLVRSIYDQS